MRRTSFPFLLQRPISPTFLKRLSVLVVSSFASIIEAQPVALLSYENFKTSSEEVETEILPNESLQVALVAGAKGLPGVIILPASGEVWDFSKFSRIEAVIQNTGDVALPVSLRVDNKGHWKEAPWSTESVMFEPGQTATVVVFFGFSHGMKPSFALDRSQVTQFLLFAPGADESRSFVVKSISVAGESDETPGRWLSQANTAPEEGRILGPEAALISSPQLTGFNGAAIAASASGDRLQIQFTGEFQSAQLRPLSGKWDLRFANRLEVEVINTGADPIWPKVGVQSTKSSVYAASSEVSVAAGEKVVIQVPFSSPTLWRAGVMGNGEQKPIGHIIPEWVSKEATGISFGSGQKKGDQSFEVTRIEAVAASVVFPEWIGKKPPVEGDWVQTLSEEFDAPDLDESIWNTEATNHWDKRSGFSRENTTVSDGIARLRFEHRTSRHDDDPEGEEKDYTTGFLDTFGKWKQRYGYFEARMKLPKAPGLWPAFWMMPDRGPASEPRWKREQTTNGGMEFDIMEYLSGWGPYRYNVAFHWDGYGKNHLHAGTSGIYFQTDEAGFFTTGLLWLPGEAIYYCNGVEVGRWECDRVSDIPSILMFTHVSGGWDNESLDLAQLPDDFVIDYVRCWQRRDLQ